MAKCGLGVDHRTIFRWVQHYAPELERRIKHQLKLV
jgi:IS6 family transposase